MQALTVVIRLDVWLLLAGLALIVADKMLTGGINMKGLLDDKMTGELSPGRG